MNAKIDINHSYSTLEERRAERERTRARVSSFEILIAEQEEKRPYSRDWNTGVARFPKKISAINIADRTEQQEIIIGSIF